MPDASPHHYVYHDHRHHDEDDLCFRRRTFDVWNSWYSVRVVLYTQCINIVLYCTVLYCTVRRGDNYYIVGCTAGTVRMIGSLACLHHQSSIIIVFKNSLLVHSHIHLF